MPRGQYDRTKAKPRRGRPPKKANLTDLAVGAEAPTRRGRKPRGASTAPAGVTLLIADRRVTLSSDGAAIVVRIEP